MSLEGYVKVTVSELSRNLVPSEENSEPKKSKIDPPPPPPPPPRPSIRFFLTRWFEEAEFQRQVQKVWIQGFVINVSKNEGVIEVADEPVASGVQRSNVDSVIVTGCDKVTLLNSKLILLANFHLKCCIQRIDVHIFCFVNEGNFSIYLMFIGYV